MAMNSMTGYEAKNLTYSEWLFTAKPEIFGLVPGWANPTGFLLLLVLVIMGLGAMPWIRKHGHFEVKVFVVH